MKKTKLRFIAKDKLRDVEVDDYHKIFESITYDMLEKTIDLINDTYFYDKNIRNSFNELRLVLLGNTHLELQIATDEYSLAIKVLTTLIKCLKSMSFNNLYEIYLDYLALQDKNNYLMICIKVLYLKGLVFLGDRKEISRVLVDLEGYLEMDQRLELIYEAFNLYLLDTNLFSLYYQLLYKDNLTYRLAVIARIRNENNFFLLNEVVKFDYKRCSYELRYLYSLLIQIVLKDVEEGSFYKIKILEDLEVVESYFLKRIYLKYILLYSKLSGYTEYLKLIEKEIVAF